MELDALEPYYGPVSGPNYVEVAPGVLANVYETAGFKYVSHLKAVTPGSGHVAAWLDSLGSDYLICNVISNKLRRMLVRRNFIRTFHLTARKMPVGHVDVWHKYLASGLI